MHWIERAFSRALFNAGSSMAARIAMIAITMSNSINVNFLPHLCMVKLLIYAMIH